MGMTINGPTEYDLTVECNDNNACKQAIVNGTDSQSLNIKCMNTSACMDITVYCPPNTDGDNKNCILTGMIICCTCLLFAFLGIMEKMKIYNLNVCII